MVRKLLILGRRTRLCLSLLYQMMAVVLSFVVAKRGGGGENVFPLFYCFDVLVWS